jgi:hypothetical protein
MSTQINLVEKRRRFLCPCASTCFRSGGNPLCSCATHGAPTLAGVMNTERFPVPNPNEDNHFFFFGLTLRLHGAARRRPR